ncbi:MAG: tyrosine-type recombinase/integrase [Anaerolineales bacterium]
MSALRRAAEKYLALRRALGFKLRCPAGLLRQFISFLEKRHAPLVTTELALEWAQESPGVQPSTWARRLGVIRQFARHWSATDPRTEVPPLGLLPHRYRRRAPYLYTQAQIVRLMAVARKLKGLRRFSYPTLFGLLAVTGLRGSEALALDRETVDLEEGLLTIHRTKFGKSRLVPLHPSTVRALRRYARRRDEILPNPRSPAFFLSNQGTRLTEWIARWTFIKLSRQIGLRGPQDRSGPRLHDFRHRFAVRTLLGWYRGGRDVERLMPLLSTYLGHTHVADTYWYLSAAPELLSLAGARLERTWGGLP